MSYNSQFVGTYNTNKAELQARHRRAIEAKQVAIALHEQFVARKAEIESLVAMTFYKVERHLQRSQKSLFKAHATAEQLARIGGDDYRDAVTALKQAFTGPEAYADACASMLIDVND